MAKKVRRSPQAAADLDDIWLSIAVDSLRAAEELAQQIYRAEGRLADFPKLGRDRPELGAGVRSWVIGSYVLFYEVDSDAVEILRILHGARDIDDAFAEPSA